MESTMRSWLRTSVVWMALAVTVLTLPAAVSPACACARMMAEARGTAGATMRGKADCPRCADLAAATARGPVLSRPSCCKGATASDVRSATTPATVQLDRRSSHVDAPAAVAPNAALRAAPVRSTRAPPVRRSRDSAAPPASYLSDYLRL
jgi:hypothetical protein